MSPLRRERKRRGWTLERVANELRQLSAKLGYGEPGVDANAVSRWELGKHQPQEPYPELFALLYETTVEALWPGTIDDMRRREFLRSLGATGVAAAVPAGRASGAFDVEAVTAATGAYRRLEATTPAAELAEPVRAHLRFVTQRLDRGGPRLAAAASEVAGLLGWLAFDQGDQPGARRAYEVAVRHAERSGSEVLGAYMLGSMALWAAEVGNGDEALTLVGSTRRRLPRNPSLTARAWIAAVEATAHAAARRPDQAAAALKAAERALGGEPEWPWVYPFDDAKLASYQGAVAVRLGRPDVAVPALRLALDPAPTKARARTLTDLAMAQLASGDPDQAGHMAGEAFALGAATGSMRVMRRVRMVRARMPEGVAAATLDGRIAALW
jgi:transcriptional regulator with XRE-family HTH domain